MGLRVWGLGFGVWGFRVLGFGVQGFRGLGFRALGLGQDLGTESCEVHNLYRPFPHSSVLEGDSAIKPTEGTTP